MLSQNSEKEHSVCELMAEQLYLYFYHYMVSQNSEKEHSVFELMAELFLEIQ